jgi:ABC-type bacteriocin/lantibiotic exporter with double-glycine peptidase domain
VQPASPQQPTGWNETVWLNRLSSAVGPERRAKSPVAAALPAMLVALGWPGTGRNLAAMLPPQQVALSLEHVERLLSDLGFTAQRIVVAGKPSDTRRLRPGSLLKRPTEVAVYLGQPDGEDCWLVDGVQKTFSLVRGDTILAVNPDFDFRPVDSAHPGWFRSLFERIRDDLFKLFAMSAFVNLLALAVSLYTMIIYSVVIPAGAVSSIWGIAFFAMVVAAGAWALRIGRQIVISRLGSWAGTQIGEAAMRKMLSFPLDVTSRMGVQNNVLRMRSFENARQFLTGVGGANLIDYPFVLIFLLVIALLGGWLVVVPIVSLLLFTAIAFPTADYVSSKSSAAGAASGRLEEHTGAAFLGIDAFHHAGAGTQWLSRLADLARESAARNRDYAIAVARAQALGQALGNLTVLATMCVGVVLVLGGLMNPGGLVAAMMLIWRITGPAQQAFSSLVRIRQIRSSVRQLDQLMQSPSERAGVEIGSPYGIRNATLAAERLYYRPDPDYEAALNGVTFTVPAGARVAIVGPNAGGKTALMECLAGLRRPQAGRVLVGGRDIRQFDTTEYRAWIGYVPQMVPALPMTIRDYLRLRMPMLRDADALMAFEHVLGPDWSILPAFSCAGNLLDRQLSPFSDDHAELKLRYFVAFVAATLGSPAILLLDGVGLGGDPMWDARIEHYLDTIRGRTTVIWSPYTSAHIQSSDLMVVLDRGSVLHVGPVAPPATKTG